MSYDAQRLPDRMSCKIVADAPGGCWEWKSTIVRGYGVYWYDGKHRKAHRVAYELLIGQIPDGLEVDHLCKNTRCVNPDHLEAVEGRVNLMRSNAVSALNARKVACHRGHPFDQVNTYVHPKNGARGCRACRAMASDKHKLKKIKGE